MNPEETNAPSSRRIPDHIDMPAPTVWPMVTAFGLTLLLAGLVTHWFVSLIGLLLTLAGAIGWFKEVMPHDRHEAIAVVPAEERSVPVRPARETVEHLVLGEGGHRVRIPSEIYPWSAGLQGGLAGMVVMAFLAVAWSYIAKGSPWFVINLLSASAFPSLTYATYDELLAFHLWPTVVAVIAHVILSLGIGWLYAVILPMFPQHKYSFWASTLIMPLAWTAVIGALMPVLNPALAEYVNWPIFVICQIGFGAACGFVVWRSEKLETMQTWPLMARAGLHGTHVIKEGDAPHNTEDDK